MEAGFRVFSAKQAVFPGLLELATAITETLAKRYSLMLKIECGLASVGNFDFGRLKTNEVFVFNYIKCQEQKK